jgi:hypothetical protein
MKVFCAIWIIIFFFLTQNTNAQNRLKTNHFGSKHTKKLNYSNLPEGGDWRMAITGENWQILRTNVYSLGFDVEYFASRNISFSSQFNIGFIQNEPSFYVHISTGAWLASYPLRLMSNNLYQSNDYLAFVAIFLMIIPETINFHIPVQDKVVIKPYLSPLGTYYFASNSSSTMIPFEGFTGGFTAGAKVDLMIGNLSFSPHFAWRKLYNHNISGVVVGFRLGVIL